MARTRKNISLDEKIAAAEENVDRTKQRYEAAVKELRDLLTKKDEERKKELWHAVEKSTKSYEEIMAYIETGDE